MKGVINVKKILIIVFMLVLSSNFYACGKSENTDIEVVDNQQENSEIEEDTQSEYLNVQITIEDVRKAEETEASLFEYSEIDGGIAITGFTGSNNIVVIPENIEGKKVIAIGDNAFVNNKTIEGIRLNESTVDIGANSFENCAALKIVLFGSSTKNIKEFAFNGCSNLSEVVLNDGLETIGMLSFGYTNMKELRIPSSVTLLDIPFTGNEDQTLTIISTSGSEAEKYVEYDGENFNLEFKAE